MHTENVPLGLKPHARQGEPRIEASVEVNLKYHSLSENTIGCSKLKHMLSPVETNYLIYRFLLESGYVHAAFMFGHESGIISAGIADRSVPVGALLTLLERACNCST